MTGVLVRTLLAIFIAIIVTPIYFSLQRAGLNPGVALLAMITAVIVVGVLTVWIGRRSLAGLGGTTRWVALAARLVVLTVLIGALAEPHIRDVAEERLEVGSVAGAENHRCERTLAAVGETHSVGLEALNRRAHADSATADQIHRADVE